MKNLFTVFVLNALVISAQAATKAEVDSLLERLANGGLDANILLYSDADRRVAFAHTDAWMPTRPLVPSPPPYALPTERDDSLLELA